MDVYVGLVQPDGSFMSLASQGAGFALGSGSGTPTPVLRGVVLNLNVSTKVATRAWGLGDATGQYVAYVVLVRAGQTPLAQANWLAVGGATLTLSP